MSIAGGLSAQFGIADETTFGTTVTPTRFLEFTDESLDFQIERIESKGFEIAIRGENPFDMILLARRTPRGPAS